MAVVMPRRAGRCPRLLLLWAVAEKPLYGETGAVS